MRELGQLEPAAAATPVRQKVWGLRQGLMFLGSVIVGGGIAAGSYFSLVVMPAPHEGDVPEAALDELQPADAWFYWNAIRRGMPRSATPDIVALVRQRDQAQRGVYVAWGAIALGGIIAASGFLVPRARLRASAA